MKNKKTLAIVIVLAVLVVALLAVYFLTRPTVTAGQKSFTLEITHSDGTVKTMQFKSDAEYVGTVLQEKGVISGEVASYGLYIHEVDGERAVYEEDEAYWAFYVNNEYATAGIDLTPIEDGMVYQLVYTDASGF